MAELHIQHGWRLVASEGYIVLFQYFHIVNHRTQGVETTIDIPSLKA
jgi:hypothetical protein